MYRSSSTSAAGSIVAAGSAVALISCGQYVAGILWPPLIALGIEHLGWRSTMLAFGIASGACMVLAVLLFLRPVPESVRATEQGNSQHTPALGVSPRLAFVLLCIAGFLCCTPMAMPPAHLVALCSDLGIAPARGALMLSVLLGSAFVSRLFWGWLSDRAGGLYTILAASICQAVALTGFIVTQDEAGLFAVSAAFGAGFSGIIPAYVVVLREIFPAGEASWRVPIWFFANICGMALGGWLAGALYDQLSTYAPAFAVGVAFNLANIVLIGWLAATYPTHLAQGTVTRLPMSAKYFLHSACPAFATVARLERGSSVTFTLGASAICRLAPSLPARAGCAAEVARTRTRATTALFISGLLTGGWGMH